MTPYYDRDGITIYCADCRDVLPQIHPSTVALLLTDPPYGINLDTDWSRWKHAGSSYEPVYGDDVPFDPRPLVSRFPRVALFGANHYAPRLPVGQWIVWRKAGASPLMAAAELCWHNCGGRPVDFYETAMSLARQRDGALHPNQKPVSLMLWVLTRLNVGAGDLVVDPYMGSGPLARACMELGIRYIGIEIVEKYCRLAVDRLRQGSLDFGGAA